MDMRTIIAEYEKVNGAAYAEYEKVNGAAWAEYEKVYGAAWAEYEKVNGAAYEKAYGAAWAAYRKACGVALAEYTKARGVALAEYTKARGVAWNAVADKTEDPLVSWIVRNCTEYRNEALAVLSVLPASLGELDALAARSGWCDVWDGFRASALADGVI